MEEKLDYMFTDGSELKIVLGEDGYNVNLSGGGYAPKMGTFTDFEHLLHGIAPIVRGCEFKVDVEMLAIQLELCFTSDYDSDEIEEILLK